MKIAMLGHKAIPSHRGGIETVLTSLCPLMVEMGHEVTVFNRSSDQTEKEAEKEIQNGVWRGVRLKVAPTWNKRGLAALIASYTAALKCAFGPYDVVHFHAEGPCGALWIPRLFGKTCIATVHGLDWKRDKWKKGFGKHYIHFGEKVMARFAHEIIVLNEETKEYFSRVYGRETHLIPNGIEEKNRRSLSLLKEKFALEEEGYIAMISRLVPEKGVHLLMDAYLSLETDKKLVIAGDTGDGEETDPYVLSLFEKAKGNENIIFTGFLSGEALEEVYSGAALAVLPSSLEGMSLGLMEALAYDLPLILSDIPENRGVAKDHAAYFEKENASDLARVLQEFLDHPEKARAIAEGSANYILSRFQWSAVAEKTAALYKQYHNPIGKGKKA